jgi:LPS-assembly protein
MRFYQIIILLFALYHTIAVYAKDEDFSLCKPFTEIAPHRPNLQFPDDDYLYLFADDALIQEKLGKSTFRGDVIMRRADQMLSTPFIIYDRNKDVVDADKDFIFWDNDFIISGSTAQLRQESQGEMTNAKYWLLNRRVRGHAEKLIKASEDIIHLEGATYTTCDPNKEIWRLSADKMTLDNAKSEGTARDVTIRILGLPVFYFPYISFPIGDERKSGFLLPNFGTSDETGTEFSIPYYLNLAPNYDATITPRYMSRRGFLLNTEFRYLTQQSAGNLEIEYMPHDQAFGAERGSLSFRHNASITKRWRTDINFNYVSDQRFFEELGTNITVASITHLERRGDLSYTGNGWLGIGRLQTFQTLDPNPAARPYNRLPQLLFQTFLPQWNRKLNTEIKAELVRFDRDISVVDGPIGNRMDFQPSLNYPLRTPGTYVVPKLSLRYTRYDLENVAVDKKTTPDRLLFTFSTDSGLFFERDVNVWNNDLIQTLEPRLFYRYTPYQDQTDIPIFDTAEYDLSYLQLFRENRFAGADRVDDGHLVSLGLSTRFLGNVTGIEYLRASLGQSYYLRDRRVTLPDQAIETDPSSNVIMELATQFTKSWRISSTIQWNQHTKETEQTVYRLRYHPDQEHILNLSYRLREHQLLHNKSLEQIDVSSHWALGRRWSIVGRWNYSIPDEKTLESFTGIEYSSCCWAVRAITRRYLNNIDGYGYSNGFFLQFHLKGLGAVGKKADSFLEQRIPGYYDEF